MFFSFLIFSLLGPRLLQFDSTAINQIGDRKVKIKYKFANETVEIEVTEEWGSILIDLDRQEYNNNHKETRRHCPLSAYSYEGEVFSVEDENLTKLIEDTEPGKLLAAILKLSPKQQELIRSIYIDKISVNEYAKRHGVTQSAIAHRLAAAKKNLKKLI